MQDDEDENADDGDPKTRIDQKDRCRHDPNRPSTMHILPKPWPKAGAPCLANPRGKAYRQDEEPCDEQRTNMASVACHKRTSVA